MPNRYNPIPLTRGIDEKMQIYQTNVYPDIPFTNEDNYVITTLGDRFDLIALDFYNDMTYWWIIVIANQLSGDSIYPPVGIQLRIPNDPISIKNSYERENANR